MKRRYFFPSSFTVFFLEPSGYIVVREMEKRDRDYRKAKREKTGKGLRMETNTEKRLESERERKRA